jgi:hypothetical protein
VPCPSLLAGLDRYRVILVLTSARIWKGRKGSQFAQVLRGLEDAIATAGQEDAGLLVLDPEEEGADSKSGSSGHGGAEADERFLVLDF